MVAQMVKHNDFFKSNTTTFHLLNESCDLLLVLERANCFLWNCFGRISLCFGVFGGIWRVQVFDSTPQAEGWSIAPDASEHTQTENTSVFFFISGGNTCDEAPWVDQLIHTSQRDLVHLHKLLLLSWDGLSRHHFLLAHAVILQVDL